MLQITETKGPTGGPDFLSNFWDMLPFWPQEMMRQLVEVLISIREAHSLLGQADKEMVGSPLILL